MATHLFGKRLIILFSLIFLGGLASLAKSLDIYGDSVRSFEVTVGGAWVLHTVIASLLGFVAAWSTPKPYYYQWNNLPISPWVIIMIVMVVTDEMTQAFNPLRQFSMLDMSINVACVLTGATLYYLTSWHKIKREGSF